MCLAVEMAAVASGGGVQVAGDEKADDVQRMLPAVSRHNGVWGLLQASVYFYQFYRTIASATKCMGPSCMQAQRYMMRQERLVWKPPTSTDVAPASCFLKDGFLSKRLGNLPGLEHARDGVLELAPADGMHGVAGFGRGHDDSKGVGRGREVVAGLVAEGDLDEKMSDVDGLVTGWPMAGWYSIRTGRRRARDCIEIPSKEARPSQSRGNIRSVESRQRK